MVLVVINCRDLFILMKQKTLNLIEICNRIEFVVKDNNDYINILKDVNNTNDLVVLVVDLFTKGRYYA